MKGGLWFPLVASRSLGGLPREEIRGGGFWKGGCCTERGERAGNPQRGPFQVFGSELVCIHV